MRRAWAALLLTGVACSDAPASSVQGDDGGAPDAADDAAPIDPASLFDGMAPFVDVGATAGLPGAGAMCVAFDDFDGDGRPDLFVASFQGSPTQSTTLYVNDGAGHFHATPLPPIAFTSSKGAVAGWCAAGDVDGDGKLDVVLGSFFGVELHTLHNTGGGHFVDAQALTTSLGGTPTFSAVALADFDGDGWLDAVVAPYGPAPTPLDCGQVTDGFACMSPGTRCASPPLLFRNLGVAGVGFLPPVPIGNATDCGAGNTNAFAVTDWDGDGRPDLFVANDWGANRLYVNGAGLAFREVFGALGTKAYNSAMGAAFEDFDFDGQLDMFVGDFGSDQFYLGTGGGQVASHAQDWGVAAPTRFASGWGPLAEDFDSDGFPDVFVTSAAFVGSYTELKTVGERGQLQARPQYDVLLHNQAGRGFTPLGVPQTKAAEPTDQFGVAAVADFDADGRLDVAEAVGYPLRFELLHNTAPPAHWLEVRLHGHAPNVDGIGGTVTVQVPGRPAWKRLVQRSRGSLGSSWATLHFGLGSQTAIDRVDVRWPDGTTQTVAAPASDAVLSVTQP